MNGENACYYMCEKGGRVAYRAHVPTNTAQTPPTPPATKDFTFSAAVDAAETGACVVILSAVACSDGSPFYDDIAITP
jgi:hypothetical protein